MTKTEQTQTASLTATQRTKYNDLRAKGLEHRAAFICAKPMSAAEKRADRRQFVA